MTHSVSAMAAPPTTRTAGAMALRGALLVAAAFALALAVVMVGAKGDDNADLAQASVTEKLQMVRAANELRMAKTLALSFGDQADANTVAAAAAAVAAKAAANVKKTDAETENAEPVAEPGFVIATTEDATPAAIAKASAPTSKLVMGPAAFEDALGNKFETAKASPLKALVVARATLLGARTTSKLDMSDEGDKDLQVANSIKETVGDKSAEGANLTASEPPFADPAEMKAIEKVQEAVKAAADAEIDEAVATSKQSAMSSYAETRNHFLEKEAKNNVTGTLLYSASNEIYHDSNKWVKELKSFKKGGQDLLSQRPEYAFAVTVPAGVAPGQQFLVQIPGGGEELVTVPSHVTAGQTVAIEVSAAVGPVKSAVQEGKKEMKKMVIARARRSEKEHADEKAQAQIMSQIDKQFAKSLEAKFLADKIKIEHNDEVADVLAGVDAVARITPPSYTSAKAIEERYFAEKKELETKDKDDAALGLARPPVQALPKETAKQDEMVKEIEKNNAEIEKSFMKNKALFDKVVKPLDKVEDKVENAKVAKTKRTQQMAKTGPKLMAKELQKEHGTIKAVWKHKKHAAANEAKVVKEVADEDTDISARTPVQTNIYDGDQKMRGVSSVTNGYWGAGATDGTYYGVTVPAGLSSGQNFLAKIPGGPEMLVTVPKGVGQGTKIAVKVPPGREESLAFGDAVVHTGSAAAQREGGVRHGVKPDFVKPLGGLGEQGLYQKPKMLVVQEIAAEKKAAMAAKKSAKAHLKMAPPASTIMKAAKPQTLQTVAEKAAEKIKSEAKWLKKEKVLNLAIAAAERPHAQEKGGFQQIEAARRKEEQAKDWRKNAARAMREVAKQQRHLHDSTHISHDDRNGYWSQKTGKTQILETGKTQILAFGDAVKHADTAAQQREGSVRHGVKPDFVKPLGTLGSTGLAQKKKKSPPLSVSHEVAQEKLQVFEREHAKIEANNSAKAAERAHAARKTARASGPSKVVAGPTTWSTDDEDVLDKEQNVFSSSENAVEDLEHKMLKKVARENAQRLKEEAAAKRLEGLPQHATRHSLAPASAVHPKVAPKKLAPQKTLQALAPETKKEKALAEEAVREKWARKEWILERIMPHEQPVGKTADAVEEHAKELADLDKEIDSVTGPSHVTYDGTPSKSAFYPAAEAAPPSSASTQLQPAQHVTVQALAERVQGLRQQAERQKARA